LRGAAAGESPVASGESDFRAGAAEGGGTRARAARGAPGGRGPRQMCRMCQMCPSSLHAYYTGALILLPT